MISLVEGVTGTKENGIFVLRAVTLVSLSKTLNHCLVLRMGRKAIGPGCCITHVKEHSALITN